MKSILYPIRVLHGRIHEWRTNKLSLIVERLKNPNAVYLVLTPEHGNLGDHAIAQSEIEILNQLNIPYIEVTGRKLREWKKNQCLGIMNGRTILINGGGNLGMLWPEVEDFMQSIVKMNPKSTVLILPNTIFYTDNKEGKELLKQSASVYNSHSDLKMYAREKESFRIMKEAYRNVSLVPDMVLRMNKCKQGVKRSGCLLCLRNDLEKTRTEEQEQLVRTQISKVYGTNVYELDMYKKGGVSIKDRDAVLESQYDAFRHAELVITDRLHGMIFSAITGTPCIVINSKSPKVKGCYDWVKDQGYIYFCEDVTALEDILNHIEKKEYTYNSQSLQPLYNILIEDICSAVGRK